MPSPELVNIAEMPNFNIETASRGDHSVTDGFVYWNDVNKVCCRKHKAMLCVSPDRRLWRCIACGVGAYVKEWDHASES